MEEMKLVGYRQVDFEDGGKHITGVSLYVVHPDVGVVGELAEKLFLSSDRLEAPWSAALFPSLGDGITRLSLLKPSRPTANFGKRGPARVPLLDITTN
mgnify:CR=1 FL=1